MTSHNEGSRTSKPSSPFEELDNRILRGYCGVKELSSPNPLDTKPKAHAEEEEMTEDEQRGSSCQEISPRTILSSASRNRKKKKWHTLKDSLSGHPKQKGLTQWANHGSMVEEQFQEKLSPPHYMPTANDLAALMRK